MPITFNCSCGKVLRVGDEFAGRRVKCPMCNSVGRVPEPEPQFEVVEDTAAPPKPQGRPLAKPATSRATDDDDDRRGYGVAKHDDDEDEDDRPRKKSRRDDDDDEEEQPKKKKKKKWAKKRSRETRDSSEGRSFEGNVVHGGIAVGILAMIGAVAWFVLGIVLIDRIFIYPPILFVIGLVAFFKGLAGEE